MATVREEVHERLVTEADNVTQRALVGVSVYTIDKVLNIPPDTENTPHAIAAAVLGMSEDDLRRKLLWGERVEQVGVEQLGDERVVLSDDGTEHHSPDDLLDWLTRPEQEVKT